MSNFEKYESPKCDIELFGLECIMAGISSDDNDVEDPFDDD